MKVAAVQFRPLKDDWSRSAERLEDRCRQAAEAGAGLIVCPEMALTGYLFPSPQAAERVAEPKDGRTYQRFGRLAQELGCTLVLGYPEKAGRALFNAALVIGPDGALRANYRKRLLYEADRPWAYPGDRPYPLLPLPGPEGQLLTVGICMDLNDDRFIRFLLQAAPPPPAPPLIVAFCTNWIHQGFDIRPYWLERLRGARCTLVAADTYGEERAGPLYAHFLGRSAILDPAGRTLALAGEVGDEVLVADTPGSACIS